MPFLDLDSAAAAPAPVLTDGAPIPSLGHTLAQLRDELLFALGNRDDVDQPKLNTWINDAYLLIASGIKLKETKGAFKFTTVSDQYLYILPAQVQFTTRASLVDSTNYPFDGGTPLDKIDVETFRLLPDNADDPPMKFFVYGNLMGIWPAGQGQTVVVEYNIRPIKMSADNDSPILPLEWHRGLLIKSKTFAYADLEEWESRKDAQNEYVGFVREIGDPVAEEKTNQVAAFRRIRNMRDLRRYPLSRPREDF